MFKIPNQDQKNKILNSIYKNHFSTKNIPDAMEWHCSYFWEHALNKEMIEKAGNKVDLFFAKSPEKEAFFKFENNIFDASKKSLLFKEVEKFKSANIPNIYYESVEKNNNLIEYKLSKNLEPQLLTNYLFDLASQFHKYYATCRIIDNENKQLTQSRIFLIKSVKTIISNGLNILGISCPKRM